MIYCNWAATSPHKLYSEDENAHYELVRSGFSLNDSTASLREDICSFLNFNEPKNVIFGSGVTDLLNKLILGFVEENKVDQDCEILTSILEHNSVLRPLNYLGARKNIAIKYVSPDENGLITAENIAKELTSKTKLCILTHASNVTGVIQPIEDIVKSLNIKGVKVIIDCAQTGGRIPIDAAKIDADALVFSTHKGLMGPSGFGFALLKNNFKVSPIFTGGTGIKSELDFQPEEMPFLLEAGTPNYEAIYKTQKCFEHFEKDNYFKKNEDVSRYFKEFVQALKKINNCKVIGDSSAERLPYVNILFDGLLADEISYMLYKSFNIITRSGLHCSPLIHKHLGTYPYGTTRISFGGDSDLQIMDRVLDTIKVISKGA